MCPGLLQLKHCRPFLLSLRRGPRDSVSTAKAADEETAADANDAEAHEDEDPEETEAEDDV